MFVKISTYLEFKATLLIFTPSGGRRTADEYELRAYISAIAVFAFKNMYMVIRNSRRMDYRITLLIFSLGP
jgi:hypothetical protein